MNLAELNGLTEIQTFLDRMDIALFSFNVQLRSAYVSEAAVKIHGYSQADFRENPMLWAEVIYPEDRNWVNEFISNWMPGMIRDREYRICRPDGEIRWVKTHCTGVFDESGSLLQIQGIIHDITDAKHLEEKVWENEKRYRAVVEHSPQPIAVVQNEVIVYSNWATAKLLGLKSREDIINRSIYDIVPSDYANLARERMTRPLNDEDIQSSEFRFKLPNGHEIIAELLSVPMVYMGKPSYLIMGNDISERKQFEEALMEAESKYRTLVEGALIGVYLLQGETFTYLNPHFQKVFGYTLEDMNRRNLIELFVEKDRPSLLESLNQLGSEISEDTRQYQVYKKNGEIADVEIQAAVTIYNGTPALIGTIQDITDQKKTTKKMREMAFTDALTGLPNRYSLKVYLEEFIKSAIGDDTQIGLMFMDLDRFKFINDTLGHEAGDFVLNEAAKRLKQCVRKDDIISRYGGDEFVIVVQDTNREGIERVANRIKNEFNRSFTFENEEVYTTPSIGICIYPFDGEDAPALIKNADTAMYVAKEMGKNNYQFYSARISDQYSRKLKLEMGLRKAIENEELELYFQPQVNFQSGEIIGFESLLRWNHPEFGLVAPSEFISIAEDIGQIVPIGKWVLETACRMNKKWQDAGYAKIPIAVNISGQQFMQLDFVEMINRILTETELEPCYLELEMTESTMKNVNILMPILAELHAMGVRTSIDDFGTGYSSLSLIKHLPIDVIKIDRSFIVDMLKSETSSLIVKAIIEMGTSLNSQIIAEGIENEDEVEFLKQTSCQVGQGYLFAHPLPAREIESLLKKRM